MKFRHKVLICNIIFVAIALAVSGYLLIRYNYRLNLERVYAASLEENQLLRTTIESDIVSRILQGDYGSLSDVNVLREGIERKLEGTQTQVYLYKKEEIDAASPFYALVESLETAQKKYMILHEDASYELLCASILGIENADIYIINVKDITEVYDSMNRQINYYRILMVVAVASCSIVMFFISVYLTRSIKTLTKVTRKMAAGDYSIRCHIRSRDEIGELGRYYNSMASAVEHHVAQLQEENRRREDFVANFTHEIKTPLTAVIGYSDMLRSKHMSEENQQIAAGYIFSEGKRLEAMSMKLFDLILLDKTKLEARRIFVPELLEAVAESVAPVVEGRGVRLAVQPCNAYIMGDKDLLKTVFINMLDNASKASRGQGTVILRALHKSKVVLIEVEDHGCGIPAEDVKKITEAFYMVDKSRSRKSGGAGLGMTLASKIIDVHGGKLKIQSEVGKGTCMQVFFKEFVPSPDSDEEMTPEAGRVSDGGVVPERDVTPETGRVSDGGVEPERGMTPEAGRVTGSGVEPKRNMTSDGGVTPDGEVAGDAS